MLAQVEDLVEYPVAPPVTGQGLRGLMSVGTRRIIATYVTDRAKTIVELGSWMGRSANLLAVCSREAHIYCIDHWMGSAEHQGNRVLPVVFDAFLENTWHLRHRVHPVRTNTLRGMKHLRNAGVTPDVVFIDASHDYASVFEDISMARTLWPMAQIIGDDWGWTQVRRAVKDYAGQHGLVIDVEGGGWALLESASFALRVKAALFRIQGAWARRGRKPDAEHRIPDTTPKPTGGRA